MQSAGRPRHLPLCQVNVLSFLHCLVRGKILLVCSPRHSQPLALLKPAASQHSFPPAHARPVLSFHLLQGTAAYLEAEPSSGNPCFDGESPACCKSADDHCCFVVMSFASFAFTRFSKQPHRRPSDLSKELSCPKAALRAWVVLPQHGHWLPDWACCSLAVNSLDCMQTRHEWSTFLFRDALSVCNTSAAHSQQNPRFLPHSRFDRAI